MVMILPDCNCLTTYWISSISFYYSWFFNLRMISVRQCNFRIDHMTQLLTSQIFGNRLFCYFRVAIISNDKLKKHSLWTEVVTAVVYWNKGCKEASKSQWACTKPPCMKATMVALLKYFHWQSLPTSEEVLLNYFQLKSSSSSEETMNPDSFLFYKYVFWKSHNRG